MPWAGGKRVRGSRRGWVGRWVEHQQTQIIGRVYGGEITNGIWHGLRSAVKMISLSVPGARPATRKILIKTPQQCGSWERVPSRERKGWMCKSRTGGNGYAGKTSSEPAAVHLPQTRRSLLRVPGAAWQRRVCSLHRGNPCCALRLGCLSLWDRDVHERHGSCHVFLQRTMS